MSEQEQKAYDLKLLAEKLKEQGLEVAEDTAKVVAQAVFSWLEDSAKISENAYDDMAVAVALPKIKEVAFKAIDKIDGQQG